MLVLTRKPAETIHIGDDITVTILRVRGRAVKIGIEAPADVQVLRSSLVAPTSPEQEGNISTRLHCGKRRACGKPR